MDRINNLSVDMNDEFNKAAVGFEFDGARYHYWIVRDVGGKTNGQWRIELNYFFVCGVLKYEDFGTVFKNPPLDVKHRGEGWFRTIKLTSNKGMGKKLFDATWLEAQKLIPAAIEALGQKQAQEEDARKQRMRVLAMEERAERLYETLKRAYESGRLTPDRTLDRAAKALLSEIDAAS
jgi:hypothetical protein